MRHYLRGAPHGVWTYWDEQGRVIAWGDARASRAEWTYREPEQGQQCNGPRQVADQWIAERSRGAARPCAIRCVGQCGTCFGRSGARCNAQGSVVLAAYCAPGDVDG